MDDNGLSQNANIIAIRSIIAYLMARDAFISGAEIGDIYSRLVYEFQDAIAEAIPDSAMLESKVISALDGIFSMADLMRRSM